MAWLYLVVAGFLEIGWPLGLKMAESSDRRVQGILTAVFFMAASGTFLWLAQRQIPMGTAYAVWTGIGAAGAAILGIALLGESAAPIRILCIVLILAGVIGLKQVS